MKNRDHLYLDIKSLHDRGWTQGMISAFLGPPDSWEPVNHWANFKGKKTYFLERVETAERSQAFTEVFQKSARRRRLGEGRVQEMLEARAKTEGWVNEWRNSLTEEDVRNTSLLLEAEAIFKEARQRGYRTPHKA